MNAIGRLLIGEIRGNQKAYLSKPIECHYKSVFALWYSRARSFEGQGPDDKISVGENQMVTMKLDGDNNFYMVIIHLKWWSQMVIRDHITWWKFLSMVTYIHSIVKYTGISSHHLILLSPSDSVSPSVSPYDSLSPFISPSDVPLFYVTGKFLDYVTGFIMFNSFMSPEFITICVTNCVVNCVTKWVIKWATE